MYEELETEHTQVRHPSIHPHRVFLTLHISNQRLAELAVANEKRQAAETELANITAENARLKQELEFVKANAEKARLETTNYELQYNEIGNALLRSDIQLAGTVRMGKKWEDQMRTCIRNQQEIQLQGGSADEDVIKEYPVDPDHANLQFQNLDQTLLQIQRFLQAGNKAVRYWRGRALGEVSAQYA